MNEIEYLRKEIDFFNMAIYVSSLVILALMIVVWLNRGDSADLTLNIMLSLAVGWAFSMARYDFLMHRPGRYIQLTEEAKAQGRTMPGWEIWKNNLPTRFKIILGLLDVGAMSPILVLVAYRFFPQAVGSFTFGATMGILFLIGTISIPFAATTFHNVGRGS